MRHLDYGGGNGTLSGLMKLDGFDSSTWDPMDAQATYPAGEFGLVTAFEVFEHTPAPLATVQEMLKLCSAAQPLIFFSTYTVDKLPVRAMDFWYLAPRNGHITVYTESSLKELFRGVGLQVHHYGNGFHLAHVTLPQWVDLSLFARLHRRGRWGRGMRKLGRLLSSS